MNGNEISTAHIALFIGGAAIISPILTALALFLLGRLFGAGDKSGADIVAIKDKVHALELAAEKSQNHTREHVAAQYATKGDIRELKDQLQEFSRAQSQYHETLMTLLTPVANQLIGVSPVRR